MKTYSPKPSEIQKKWHVLDATDRPLGRLATEAATLLRGKHKPTFAPNLDLGDFVIIVNADKVAVTGDKETGKVYYRHSGYPGGLKQATFAEVMAKNPRKVVEKAVWGMLPKGRLGRRIITHLKVYAGPEHPHQAQIAGNEQTGAKA